MDGATWATADPGHVCIVFALAGAPSGAEERRPGCSRATGDRGVQRAGGATIPDADLRRPEKRIAGRDCRTERIAAGPIRNWRHTHRGSWPLVASRAPMPRARLDDGYRPVSPSTISRNTSACPAWRAVSSSRCIKTQRRLTGASLPTSRHGSLRLGAAATTASVRIHVCR
jgi:hypothetical protein